MIKVRMLAGVVLLVCVIVISGAVAHADEKLTGDWQGTAETSDEKTGFILHIGGTAGRLAASVSLPDIGVSKWPARDLEITGDRLTLNLPSDQ